MFTVLFVPFFSVLESSCDSELGKDREEKVVLFCFVLFFKVLCIYS